MIYSEDHIALAAEYALGTLDADERALVETMMTVDHSFRDVVLSWERKLAPLTQMVGAIEPPAHVWDKIRAEVGAGSSQAAIALPEFVQQPVVAPEVKSAPQPAPTPSFVPVSSNVVPMASRRRGSGAFGFIMTAVAASLAGVVALQAYRPELLPEQLRIKPKVQVVEVAAPAQPPSSQFVAVLQPDASPAFILTVDTATKNFTVRKVGAVAEAGKSYELWLVSDKLQRPRSLGVIGGSDFTIRPALAAYDSDTINKATYAVTLEPEGGSPTGVATGPIVYAGKLVETVPQLPASAR